MIWSIFGGQKVGYKIVTEEKKKQEEKVFLIVRYRWHFHKQGLAYDHIPNYIIKPKIWACAAPPAPAAPVSRFLHLTLNLNYSIIFLATSILHTNFGNLREWAIQICFQKRFLTFGSGPKIVFWKHIFWLILACCSPARGPTELGHSLIVLLR